MNRLQQLAGIQEADIIPGDVKNLDKAQQSATSVQSKAKNINNVTEFEKAFDVWFSSLGIEPGKGGATKQALRAAAEKVLTAKGYK